MAIQIFFRGVGAYVPQGKNKVTEVLFPWAEDLPPDHTTEADGTILHADRSRATQHYAGVLVVPAPGKGDPFHVRLAHKRVTIAGDKGADIDPAVFGDRFPSITRPTKNKKLKLIAESDRDDKTKVATWIKLGIGDLTASDNSAQPKFMVDGIYGDPDGPKQYSVSATWA